MAEYDNQIPGLFKEECWGKRNMELTSRCYYVAKGDSSKNQICSERVSRQNKVKTRVRYVKVLTWSKEKSRATYTAVLGSLIKGW